jgi:hypothetical protein
MEWMKVGVTYYPTFHMKGLRKNRKTLRQTVSGLWFESLEYEALMLSTEHRSPSATHSTSVTGEKADPSLSEFTVSSQAYG